MIRTEITNIDTVPAHLRTAAGAALAARLQVSLWQVRELTVLHVNDGGADGWRIWMPMERDSDALEVYTRCSVKHGRGVISMHNFHVSCEFTGSYRAVVNAADYHNDMGAALRGAITNAALRLYKYEHTHNLI